MDVVFLALKAVVIGLAVAAPTGPVGVYCLRRTLAHGRLAGVVAGLGSSVMDGLFALIAAFGVSSVANLLLKLGHWLRLGGGAFLIAFGLKIFLSKPKPEKTANNSRNWLASMVTTFFLTLTNPLIIISLAAIFAGVLGQQMGEGDDPYLAVLVTLGVFTGSALWFTLLSFLAGMFRNGLDARRLVWINRIAGALLMVMGAVILVDTYVWPEAGRL